MGHSGRRSVGVWEECVSPSWKASGGGLERFLLQKQSIPFSENHISKNKKKCHLSTMPLLTQDAFL